MNQTTATKAAEATRRFVIFFEWGATMESTGPGVDNILTENHFLRLADNAGDKVEKVEVYLDGVLLYTNYRENGGMVFPD